MWHEVKQNTEEWLRVRLGKITGSGVAPLLTKGRKKDEYFGAGANTYIDEKVTEILTAAIPDQNSGRACEWGNEHEDEAIEVYELETWQKVERKGFYEGTPFIGCSPDGVVGNGIIEVKCPYNSVNHYKVLKSGEIPKEYKPQVFFNMWVTDSEWCDFISFDPRFKGENKLVIIRVTREENEEYIENMAERVRAAAKIIEEDLKRVGHGK